VAVGELGARVARASRSEAQRRLDRLRERAVFIAQCGVAAGLSWFLARWWLGHPAPVFAPVTAIVCLGLSYGHRVRRALELMLGVAVGVVIGDLFVQVFGAGPGQVAFVVALAMASAALLGSGQLITTQAGVQALFVIGYAATPTQGLSRWLEALVGGLVAVVFALAVPRATFTRPRAALTDLLERSSTCSTTPRRRCGSVTLRRSANCSTGAGPPMPPCPSCGNSPPRPARSCASHRCSAGRPPMCSG